MLLLIGVLAAMTIPLPAPVGSLAPGTRVRLSAPPSIEIPGLYSADGRRANHPSAMRRDVDQLLDGGRGLLEGGRLGARELDLPDLLP